MFFQFNLGYNNFSAFLARESCSVLSLHVISERKPPQKFLVAYHTIMTFVCEPMDAEVVLGPEGLVAQITLLEQNEYKFEFLVSLCIRYGVKVVAKVCCP